MLDEHFIYIMKDKEDINHCINNKQNTLRKCHKYYDLRNVSNISSKKIDGEKMTVSIVFNIGNNLETLNYKTKVFYFFIENAKKFLQMLNFYLRKLNIEIKLTEY